MTVKALARLMNNDGTDPQIYVLTHSNDGYVQIAYSGPPRNIDQDTAMLRVTSFTAIDRGAIVIYTK